MYQLVYILLRSVHLEVSILVGSWYPQKFPGSQSITSVLQLVTLAGDW